MLREYCNMIRPSSKSRGVICIVMPDVIGCAVADVLEVPDVDALAIVLLVSCGTKYSVVPTKRDTGRLFSVVTGNCATVVVSPTVDSALKMSLTLPLPLVWLGLMIP